MIKKAEARATEAEARAEKAENIARSRDSGAGGAAGGGGQGGGSAAASGQSAPDHVGDEVEQLRAQREKDQQALRGEFDKFADSREGGEPRMTRAGLAKALAALHLQREEGEVDELMQRYDINSDGVIDFAEFCVLVQSDSQMEMLVRGFKLERIVASNLKKGSADGPLAAFAEMTEKAVEEAVKASVPLMVACLQSQVKKAKQARSAMHKVALSLPHALVLLGVGQTSKRGL